MGCAKQGLHDSGGVLLPFQLQNLLIHQLKLFFQLLQKYFSIFRQHAGKPPYSCKRTSSSLKMPTNPLSASPIPVKKLPCTPPTRSGGG
ncbi:hypothetical protein D3C73_1481410 [compost metagenome]